jgi:hypothetical protein
MAEFDDILYIPDEATFRDLYSGGAGLHVRAAKKRTDTGRLVAAPGVLEFQGSKGTVRLTGIKGLSMTSGMANVVKVEHGEGAAISVAFFGHKGTFGAKKRNQEVLAAMQGEGIQPAQLAPDEAAALHEHRAAEHAAGSRRSKVRIILGAILVAGGLIATIVTYTIASSKPSGGTYILAWGPIIFGLVLLIQGIGERRGLKR